jgi:cardiolipin synthase
VCWHFELLPRWGIAVLALRELLMLGLVRYGLRHGLDLKINWLGRAGVWPVMSALFFAMAGLETVGEVCLYLGLALVIGSTIQYVRDGVRAVRTRPSSTG